MNEDKSTEEQVLAGADDSAAQAEQTGAESAQAEAPTGGADMAAAEAAAGVTTDAAQAGAEKATEAEVQTETAKHQAAEEAAKPAPDVGMLTSKLADAELRAAAAVAGVPAAKIPYLVRMCDAGKLAADGVDMGKMAADQVAAVLRDVPELSGGGLVVGSMGEHKRLGSDPAADAAEVFRRALNY